MDHLIPPGIRAIYDDSYVGGYYSILQELEPLADWKDLQYLQVTSSVESEKLSRILAPSLASGSLKGLSLNLSTEQLRDFDVEEAQHVQALGLMLDFENTPLFFGGHFSDWVAKFPNAHTFYIRGDPSRAATALAELVLRPGTRRIFENALMGAQRDQLLNEARKRGVEVVRASLPIVFPWTFGNDDGVDNEGVPQPVHRQVDIIEQLWNARGTVQSDQDWRLPKVSNNPFFRE